MQIEISSAETKIENTEHPRLMQKKLPDNNKGPILILDGIIYVPRKNKFFKS